MTGLNATAATALYLLPQDIIENTVRAFNVSATTANGYSSLGAPTGRYLAPANGPDCIEIAVGSGECGTRTLVLTGPMYSRVDLSAVKRDRDLPAGTTSSSGPRCSMRSTTRTSRR